MTFTNDTIAPTESADQYAARLSDPASAPAPMTPRDIIRLRYNLPLLDR